MLLGVVDLGEGTALKVLENLNVAIGQLRNAAISRLQALPRESESQPARETGSGTNLPPITSPASSAVPKRLIVTTLPQEKGR